MYGTPSCVDILGKEYPRLPVYFDTSGLEDCQVGSGAINSSNHGRVLYLATLLRLVHKVFQG